MTNPLPADDQPPAEWRRPASDEDAAKHLPQKLDATDPVAIAGLFLWALEDPENSQEVLLAVTTPESHEAWGDFSDTARLVREIKDPGFGSRANLATGTTDVAYFKILSGVTESYTVVDEQPVMAAAIITLVWRPEHGRWLIHSIGDYLRPEELPRTAQDS